MAEPAYTRLDVDERRRQLLDLGADLFTRFAYDEISMAGIAREAGISKALLYHYFPSKQAYFQATLAQAADELRLITEPAEGQPPLEALLGSLDAYLAWIEEHETAYRKLLQSVGSVPEVRELVEGIRSTTADRIVEGLPLAGDPPPQARAAVLGWLWFMDGACLEWLDRRAFTREELKGMLLGTLLGALTAAGASVPVEREALDMSESGA
jgi:AcrR family transcriptional regulator